MSSIHNLIATQTVSVWISELEVANSSGNRLDRGRVGAKFTDPLMLSVYVAHADANNAHRLPDLLGYEELQPTMRKELELPYPRSWVDLRTETE